MCSKKYQDYQSTISSCFLQTYVTTFKLFTASLSAFRRRYNSINLRFGEVKSYLIRKSFLNLVFSGEYF